MCEAVGKKIFLSSSWVWRGASLTSACVCVYRDTAANDESMAAVLFTNLLSQLERVRSQEQNFLQRHNMKIIQQQLQVCHLLPALRVLLMAALTFIQLGLFCCFTALTPSSHMQQVMNHTNTFHYSGHCRRSEGVRSQCGTSYVLSLTHISDKQVE